MSGPTASPPLRAAHAGAGERTHIAPGLDSATLPLGSHLMESGGASFVVWAPSVERMRIRLHGSPDRTIDMDRDGAGYHVALVDDVRSGARYSFVLPDDTVLPDPASRLQADGVHGPSVLVDTSFDWQSDDWQSPDLTDVVLYEMHIGTFTPEGTFDAAAARLPALRDLGISAVEVMPVAQFPGARNWGYDGVLAFATQNSYGGPEGFKRFVDAAHALDMAVILDVVYNHVGPEGNYLGRYGPYFIDTYHTPWGDALNLDGPGSDHVRRYFIESALQWIDEFRIDGLRLDAIHAIIDRSAQPFLRELADAVRERAARTDRRVILIAESDLGDPRVIRPARLGGLGLDAQWLDDFHHSLRTLLTGDATGYYADFGTLAHLSRAYQRGFVYAGEFSRYRGRRHGAPAPDILPRQFVVYAQNHDQVGNRMAGDRLTGTLSADQLRLAAAAVLLSPFTPMLFQGEEYGTTRPFPFFVEFGDADLIDAVRRGRREEFASFSWRGEPPDPQAEETFRSAVLDWDNRDAGEHAALLDLYRRLLALRRTEPSIRAADAIDSTTHDLEGGASDGSGTAGVIAVRRRAAQQTSLLLLNFAGESAQYELPASQSWRIGIDTAPGSSRDGEPAAGRVRIAGHSAILLLHDEA